MRLALKKGIRPKSPAEMVHRSQREPAIALLNGHAVKLPSSHVCKFRDLCCPLGQRALVFVVGSTDENTARQGAKNRSSRGQTLNDVTTIAALFSPLGSKPL